ncbi:MAG TPA: hypothetical protein VMR37_08445 [Rhabdochlamydiaceae bacterium]|nr:hypothetical protein [Rhabdochlamydiaceae bacterium]
MTSTLNSENKSSVRDRFQKVAKNKNTQESTGEFWGRNAAQLGARAAETLVGLPGNIKKQFQKEIGELHNLFSLGPVAGEELDQPEEGSLHELFMNPPGSAELREQVTPLVAEKLSGDKDYLEPRSEKEKFAGELTQDITSFFTPGNGMHWALRVGAPIVGNLVGEGAKFLGASEETAEKIKLGAMFITSVAGQSNPGRFASQQIGTAKNMIPQNATANVTNLAPRIMPLMRRLVRGVQVPSKARATQGIQDLSRQIQNGRMSLHSLMDARDNINEWISEAGGWDVPTNIRDAGIRNLNDLKRGVIETIDENLRNRFPEAADLYRNGYEAAAVTHRSNAVSRFIEKNFGRKTASLGAKLLFPAVAGGAAILPKSAAVGAGLFPIYKTGQVLYRVSQSPTLAGYYRDVITHSLAGNAPGMARSMEKLDKALKEDEKKNGIINPESLEEFKKKIMKKD